ncbi:transcriptional regulator [Pannus brasiliensis CCIBt3594]|uniref:Transcriptional regulator n=1 Tax=Pannus brasiliensis CCIBt3594 TaxID=1427578 RepID=A0AAW9QXZ5_9CHRO
MNIRLTPDRERFIASKLEGGKYRSADEVLAIAPSLLEEFDRAEALWIEEVREKIDAALAISETTPPADDETSIDRILERFPPV